MGLPNAGASSATALESISATELCDWYDTGTDRYRWPTASTPISTIGTITYQRRRSTASISPMVTNAPERYRI